MCITLNTSGKNTIKIINTCAPHMGYSIGERTKYWKELSGITKQLNKNDFVIRRTENNGQIGENEDNKIQEMGIQQESAKGNGETR